MSRLKVHVYSHNFSVSNIPASIRHIVARFSTWFDCYKWVESGGQWSKEYDCSYSFPSLKVEEVDRKSPDLEYRFHINSLQHFKALLAKELVRDSDVEYVVEPIYQSIPVKFKVRPEFAPLPHQVPILPNLYKESPSSKILPLHTGGGKSYLSLMAAAHWGVMSVFLMKYGYIDKWKSDIAKTLDIPLSKIATVSGSEELQDLIYRIDEGSDIPHIALISNGTFRAWLAAQEKLPAGVLVSGYPCLAHEFMQHCGFGFRVIDEVHQDFHANYRFDLVTHVEQSLSLSATLVSRDEFLKKMYKMAYPDNAWLEVPQVEKYINAASWHYDLFNPNVIRTTSRGRSTYSHVEFEKSIMRTNRLYKQYFLMIYEVLRKTFLVNRKQGERCIVYFGTRKMCEDAVFYFRQLMPGFKISKFNQGDKLTNITESDLTFATLGKAGTAIDVANLTTVLLTVAIDSIQSNLQSSGRLRNIKQLYKSDRDPLFVWFVCENINKHKQYHKSKKELLKAKAMHINEMRHNVSLGI